MKKIYSYNIQNTDSQVIRMTKGAEILNVKVEESNKNNFELDPTITLWALIDPEEKESEDHRFHLIMENQRFNDEIEMKYISTLQLLKGTFILHVFVEINNPL